MKKVLLEISENSQEDTCAILFFNRVADLRSAILSKKRLWHRCFPENFPKFLRTLFLQNTSRRMLLCFGPNNFVRDFKSNADSEGINCYKIPAVLMLTF